MTAGLNQKIVLQVGEKGIVMVIDVEDPMA